MKNRWSSIALLLAGATVLGATVFRAPIAHAAQEVTAIIIGPLDARGNLRVHEQGTANVTGAVTVDNNQTNPVPVRNVSVQEPVQFRALTTFQYDGYGVATLATVPAGKRLVVERASVSANVKNASGVVFCGLVVQQTLDTDHFVCEPGAQNVGNYYFNGGRTTKFYVEAGDTLTFIVQTLSGSGEFTATASGYYVSVP